MRHNKGVQRLTITESVDKITSEKKIRNEIFCLRIHKEKIKGAHVMTIFLKEQRCDCIILFKKDDQNDMLVIN